MFAEAETACLANNAAQARTDVRDASAAVQRERKELDRLGLDLDATKRVNHFANTLGTGRIALALKTLDADLGTDFTVTKMELDAATAFTLGDCITGMETWATLQGLANKAAGQSRRRIGPRSEAPEAGIKRAWNAAPDAKRRPQGSRGWNLPNLAPARTKVVFVVAGEMTAGASSILLKLPATTPGTLRLTVTMQRGLPAEGIDSKAVTATLTIRFVR